MPAAVQQSESTNWTEDWGEWKEFVAEMVGAPRPIFAYQALQEMLSLPTRLFSKDGSAFELLFELQQREEALAVPTPGEVKALVVAYEQVAEQLEAMGEVEKAADVLQVLLPAFLQRDGVAAVLFGATPAAAATTG